MTPKSTLKPTFRRWWLAIIAGMVLPFTGVHSQGYVTIGDGAFVFGTNNNSPYNYLWESRRVQFIVLASEITAAGGVAGNIQRMAWQITEVGGPMTNYTIKIGHTNNTTLPTTTPLAGLTTVQTYASYTPAGTGFQDMIFTTPFNWNGTQNLVIDVCWGVNSSFNATGNIAAHAVTGTRMRARHSASSNMCAINPFNQSLTGFIPTIRFYMATPPPVPCLSAPFGEYPPGPVFVACTGAPSAVSPPDAWAGEYTTVSLSAGVPYTFTSSNGADWITVSDDAGTVGLAFGTGPVNYTPSSSGNYRFYTHLNVSCGSAAVGRTRFVTCPIQPCAPPTTSDYSICQGGSVPGGEGLTSAACGNGIGGDFSTTSTFFTGGFAFVPAFTWLTAGTISLPALPPGAVLTGVQMIFEDYAANVSWYNEGLFGLSGIVTEPPTYPAQGYYIYNPGSGGGPPVTVTLNMPLQPAYTAGGTLNLHFQDIFGDLGITMGAARIRRFYQLPTPHWYDAPTGGNLVAYGTTVFDPVGALLVDPNTPSSTTYYAECGIPCIGDPREAATFTVVAPSFTYYLDDDDDGYGDAANSIDSCDPSPPVGYVDNDDDCDDSDDNLTVEGNSCDDGDPDTVNDVVTASCTCEGTPVVPCTEDLFFAYDQTTNYQDLVWTVYDQTTDAVVVTGGINPGEGSVPLCLPDGCYYLRVTNSGGNTITGGYRLVLKDAVGAYGNARIIDDTDNLVLGAGGDSGINGNQGFCIPLGTDEPIYTSCDRYWWSSGDYLVGKENPTVSAEFGGPYASSSGYEFWFYDPNGGLSFRKTRVHTVSDGFAPNNAVRACHIKLNNWAAVNQLQNGVLYNVRSRGVVAGNPLSEFGPACRVTLDPVLATCPPTGLNDIPGNPNFSCGVTKKFGGPNQLANRLFARPVAGANLYEWEFTNDPNEPAYLAVLQTTGVQRHLNWTSQPAMSVGNTYRVRVRASKNNGATWCAWGWTCEVTIVPSAAPGNENMALEGETASSLALWPNPNNGQQVWITLDELAAEVGTVAVDLYDLSGKRVMAREIATQGGHLYTNFDLGGLAAGTYLVTITAGDEQHVRRLVVQP